MCDEAPLFLYAIGQRVRPWGLEAGSGLITQRRYTERQIMPPFVEYLVEQGTGLSAWWYEPDVMQEDEDA